MSDKLDNVSEHPESEQPKDFRLERRLFVLKAAAVLSGAAAVTAAATLGTTTPAEAQCRTTDSNSFDRAGRPRPCPRGRRRRSRVTDSNSFDPANRLIYR